MAERWQQWMPFHIDKWRGSPSVQAMHPAAQMGYLNMLCSCWQSPDCCLPDDAMDLATESRLGDDLWAQYGPRILRKFVLIAGRWRNEVLFREWEEARKVYEKRKSGALRTNLSRSAYAERTDTERSGDAEPTHKHKQEHIHKQKEEEPIAQTSQSESTLDRGRALGTIPCSGSGAKQFTFYEADVGEWEEAFPGVDVIQQLRQCRQWNIDNPKKRKTANGMRRSINSWLSRAQDNASRGGSNGTYRGEVRPNPNAMEQRKERGRQAIVAAFTDFARDGADGSAFGLDARQLPEPRSDRRHFPVLDSRLE